MRFATGVQPSVNLPGDGASEGNCFEGLSQRRMEATSNFGAAVGAV